MDYLQYEFKHHNIIIQLQTGLKIALFYKLEYFKYIVLNKSYYVAAFLLGHLLPAGGGGLSTLVKKLMVATHVMQSSSYELSTRVCGKAKCKQAKATT